MIVRSHFIQSLHVIHSTHAEHTLLIHVVSSRMAPIWNRRCPDFQPDGLGFWITGPSAGSGPTLQWLFQSVRGVHPPVLRCIRDLSMGWYVGGDPPKGGGSHPPTLHGLAGWWIWFCLLSRKRTVKTCDWKPLQEQGWLWAPPTHDSKNKVDFNFKVAVKNKLFLKIKSPRLYF